MKTVLKNLGGTAFGVAVYLGLVQIALLFVATMLAGHAASEVAAAISLPFIVLMLVSGAISGLLVGAVHSIARLSLALGSYAIAAMLVSFALLCVSYATDATTAVNLGVVISTLVSGAITGVCAGLGVRTVNALGARMARR